MAAAGAAGGWRVSADNVRHPGLRKIFANVAFDALPKSATSEKITEALQCPIL